ncbi:hypothetical protein BV20DRAFT_957358 [Pilatotrama ljubarskyi]|nr:hypothetical protein BV20DRAFT_957358 [Pilatotrama ljubarskyi]
MLLLKPLLLVTSAILCGRVLTPPRPRVSEATYKVYKGQLFEYLVRSLAYLACYTIIASSLSQTILLLINQRLSPVESWLCPAAHDMQPLAAISTRFLVGFGLVLLGSTVRLWSFRALGKFFMYEVTLQHDHRLITSGPYAFARHPSYTSMLLLLIGEHLMQFGPSGYLLHCGIDHTPFGFLIILWRFATFFASYSLIRRCDVEDKQLCARFGAEWKDYATKVQYKILPYIL